MEFTNFISFIGVAVLPTLAPGSDIMYLLAKSFSGGVRQGITLAMGLSSGAVFHTVLVAAGVAAFVQNSPAAFRVLMYAGAAYLLYLAWGAFRTEPAAAAAGTTTDEICSFSLYKRGFLMNAMNPKVLLFFLALLPQFVRTEAVFSPPLQVGLLGLGFSVQSFIVFSLVVLCASQIREKLMTYRRFPLIMNRVEGGVLILIAAGLLFF